MKSDIFFKKFIETIQHRIPERGKLAETLTDILCIEKEAVYRRLRGTVPFSFQEIYKIALSLGLSLDGIAEGISPANKHFTMQMLEFLNPEETDYQILENFILNIRHLEDDPESESGSIGSIIPTSLCVDYECLYRFYLFKWSYQFGDPQKLPVYDDIHATERLNRINRLFFEGVQNSPKSIYIFDRRFIENFVGDIRYFFDIRLISREDVLNLKKDLCSFLDNLERYATRGIFDTGNVVEIYLANIHFEASYNYIDAKTFKLTMVRSFTLSDAYSFDDAIFENMKRWLHFLKRTSTMICVSNVMERVLFFDAQRKIIDSL
jgi:putative flippase GtrA